MIPHGMRFRVTGAVEQAATDVSKSNRATGEVSELRWHSRERAGQPEIDPINGIARQRLR